MDKVKKTKKPKKVSNIILNAVCIFVFVFAVYELIIKFTNNSIYLFGVRSDVVLSDSMSYVNKEDKKVQTFLEGHNNRLHKGDLVYSSKVTKKTKLDVYDIVLFKNKDNNKITIHRIVEIKDGSKYYDGQERYIIRADTASYGSNDGAYLHDEIIAKYKYKIAGLGYVSHFLASIYGVILEVGIIVIIIVYQLLDDKFFKKSLENADSKQEQETVSESVEEIKDEKNE